MRPKISATAYVTEVREIEKNVRTYRRCARKSRHVETFQARISCRISSTPVLSVVWPTARHSFLYANGSYGPDYCQLGLQELSKGASGMTLLDTLNEKTCALRDYASVKAYTVRVPLTNNPDTSSPVTSSYLAHSAQRGSGACHLTLTKTLFVASTSSPSTSSE